MKSTEVASSPAARNPPWSRDELILALDLYLKNRASPPSKSSAEVAELSAILEKMSRSIGRLRSGTFRNINGIYMKMMNFRRFDPYYIRAGKRGLQRGGKDEKNVWDEFAPDPGRLEAVANAICDAVRQDEVHQLLSEADEPGIVDAAEGRLLTRLHRRRERNGRLVARKKRQAWKKHGQLRCEACGFSFADKYGEDASGIIDCHHTKPVHTLGEKGRTRLEDLALLCANCHRVIHSRKRWLSIEELCGLLRSK